MDPRPKDFSYTSDFALASSVLNRTNTAHQDVLALCARFYADLTDLSLSSDGVNDMGILLAELGSTLDVCARRQDELHPGVLSLAHCKVPALHRNHTDSYEAMSTLPPSIAPENAFLLPMVARWLEPPLSYYTMVSSKAVAVLERLARWPSPLPRHEQFPLPPSVQTPTGSFVIDDLLALGQDLINYHDLCAQDSTPMDTVASVMDLLLKSYLTQPWRTGHRVVSMSNIAATDRGMLRCRLGWEFVMGRLGSRFVFGDYHWQYTLEELDKVFPAPPATLPKFDRARKEYLDRRGREPWAASVRTPPGWFSDMHTDFAGLAQAIVHFEGEKLWLLWPATAKNLKWWGLQHPQPWIGHPSRLLEALDSLEGLEIMHVSDPCAFIVPPFCIHAVIAFAGSSHTCVSFAHAAHWATAQAGLEFCKGLVRNPMYPANSAVELVEKVEHEAPLWEKVMGKKSQASAYLAAWKRDTAAIYLRHKNRNVSSV
ncbi:hypothetical protein R3P38DRAFT_2912079 [Favolaschia claudopus]|uniref:JmjC domain-containing protein n=1 Tax=Favolaschia claudopus TaxID=2862362 RepID=A0AAW0C5D7_9AGAR